MPRGRAEEAVRAQERFWKAPPAGAGDRAAGATRLQERSPASPSACRKLPLLAGAWCASGKVASLWMCLQSTFCKDNELSCFLYRQGTSCRVGEQLISGAVKKCARTEVRGTMVNS